MADAVTSFSTLSTDAVNVWIAEKQYPLLENRLVVGSFAERYSLPQRMGKTMRITRHRRLTLPRVPLTEGTPPDAVALSVENVDVTVEQWGIVALLTDVAQITTQHPALQIAIDRTGLAMSEVLEREQCVMLMAGTNVFYPAAVTTRAGIGATDKMATALILKTTAYLRTKGAMEWEGGLFGGVMHPNQEADVNGSDTTFQGAQNFQGIRKFEFAEIGVWMGTRWKRGNFMPVLKGQGIPIAGTVPTGTLAAGDLVPHVEAVDGGGTIVSGGNYKFAVVFRDAATDYERHITQPSANIAAAATGNNESFVIRVTAGSVVNYTYDVYATVAGGAGSLFKVASRQTATSFTMTAAPAGTEATCPAPPAATREVFVAWVFGKGAFGRVELNGMSLQSYLTPPGASYSNPLAQGRKVGSKIMWKSFLIDNDFFARLETASTYTAALPA